MTLPRIPSAYYTAFQAGGHADWSMANAPCTAACWVRARGTGYVLHGDVTPRFVPPVLDREGRRIRHRDQSARDCGMTGARYCGYYRTGLDGPRYSVGGYSDWNWPGVRFWAAAFPHDRRDVRQAGTA